MVLLSGSIDEAFYVRFSADTGRVSFAPPVIKQSLPLLFSPGGPSLHRSTTHDRQLGRKRKFREQLGVLQRRFRVRLQELVKLLVEASHRAITSLSRFLAKSRSSLGKMVPGTIFAECACNYRLRSSRMRAALSLKVRLPRRFCHRAEMPAKLCNVFRCRRFTWRSAARNRCARLGLRLPARMALASSMLLSSFLKALVFIT